MRVLGDTQASPAETGRHHLGRKCPQGQARGPGPGWLQVPGIREINRELPGDREGAARETGRNQESDESTAKGRT